MVKICGARRTCRASADPVIGHRSTIAVDSWLGPAFGVSVLFSVVATAEAMQVWSGNCLSLV